MKQLRVEEVRSIALGWRLSLGMDTMVTGVSIDSRTAGPGDVFVAIRGENFDGHNFLAQAAQAGCVTALVQRDSKVPKDICQAFPGGVIGVADTVRALADLACHQRKSISGSVVGVTGSNGKTTVKCMIDHILKTRYRGLASPKSFNNEIGVPLTLLDTDGGEDYVICELGTNAPGEIANLARISEPDIAVITMVAPVHLEKLKSIERIAAEKASILGGLRSRGLGIVNADHELLDRSVRAYDRRLVRFGESSSAELRLSGYQTTGAGCRFELNSRLWVEMPIPGKHNAINALAAIGVAQRFGFGQEESARALADFAGVTMRLQALPSGGVQVFNDAYNANPSSMLAAADVLVDSPAERRIFIAGDMLELGQSSPQLHEQLGADLAGKGFDLIVGIGELGSLVARAAAGAGAEAQDFADLDAAIAELPGQIQPGDVVLVKGSRAMRMEQLAEAINRHFGTDS
ncbi:MAG: UDP-N-acetylmuramoyl-tripeptide--D-alanyl-D-alanine ligase [Phycisphaerae bacterium]